MITTLGRSLLMNRSVNDIMKPIRYMALGKGTNNPSRQDLKLGKETVRKEVDYSIDIDNNMIVFQATFTAAEVLNTTEIGLLNEEDILICRDVYETITDEILEDTTSSINMEYNIHFDTGAVHSKWATSTIADDILYKYEINPVIGVRELNTNTGYVSVASLNDLDDLQKAGYYYDVVTKNLYIKTSNLDTLSSIDSKQIVILTK